MWHGHQAVTAALKYLTAGVMVKLGFFSENEAKNPAFTVQYLGQIEKK